jgi:LacI family transcriptional regulator
VSVTIADRFAGIEQALADAGVAPAASVDIWPWEVRSGHDGTVQLLDQHPPVTALLCLNDRLAFGAYQALQERSIRVPDDISVASFDDDDVIADNLRPGLTTARLQYEEMGRLAMELALDPDAPEGTQRVPMPVHVRGSIGRRQA